MSISQLARSIADSPTLRLNEQARILREKGDPVIHLGAGEPKSKIPMEAIRSAAAQITSGEVRYTPTDGIPELKKAIIRYRVLSGSHLWLLSPEDMPRRS